MKTQLYILFAIAAAALAGCTAATVSLPSDTPNLESRAQSEAAAGNLRTAVQIYRELADRTVPARRAGYLIDGALLLIELADTAAARQWLSEASSAAQFDEQKVVSTLLARVELDEGRPDVALETLTAIRPPMPVELRGEIAVTRGQALMRVGRYADGLGEFVARESLLDSAEGILANQRLIWDELGAAVIRAPVPALDDPVVEGWLALAPLTNLGGDPGEFRRALLEWRSVYVDHPAAGGLLAELLSEQRQAQLYPRQVALLLPLSSAQRPAAVAIRDGFLAAHFSASADNEAAVRVYDTTALGAADAYLRAQLDGADFIVGPLLKPNVEQVIGQSGFIPTLALNFAELDTPFLRSFYQFALAPEDEARAVARQAIAAGARTAVAIVSSDDWGYDLLDSFRSEFEASGGRVLEFGGYDTAQQDFSAPIASLLNISRSSQRHRRLAENLGVAVEFEPRRRQDVDMIFIAADTPQAGRLLAPQLRFHNAGDIPAYATSAIYEPDNGSRDSDLNGIVFPDAPMLVSPDETASFLRLELQSYWPQRVRRWIRFYGMGFDAYHLMTSLYGPGEPAWPLVGVSGDLSPDGQGRIRRALPFAQFRNGRPVPLPQMPAETEAEPLEAEPRRAFIGLR